MHQCSFFNEQIVYYLSNGKGWDFVPLLKKPSCFYKKQQKGYTQMLFTLDHGYMYILNSLYAVK